MLAVLAALVIGRWQFKPVAHAEPQKTDREIYEEKGAEIFWLKYDEEFHNQKAAEAKVKKDSLLESLKGLNQEEQ